ncbi:hypothetical protein SLEP1_g34896 [Rubroshorea leprosula]|uniref:Uncharacterized protein n=1 Tax=Rubroshorea leprosula TaxID=152421 RepID=A0AAV5KLF7_9ROSI|nr:hypothetical protein SLEP1_g34896 [Rubroshorea leprosula]
MNEETNNVFLSSMQLYQVNHSEHCSFSQPDKRKSLLLSNFEALFRIFIAGYSYRLWTNKTHSTTKRF